MFIPFHPPCFHQNVQTGSGAGTRLVVHQPPSSAEVPIEWSYVYAPSTGTTAPLPPSFPPTVYPHTPSHGALKAEILVNLHPFLNHVSTLTP